MVLNALTIRIIAALTMLEESGFQVLQVPFTCLIEKTCRFRIASQARVVTQVRVDVEGNS